MNFGKSSHTKNAVIGVVIGFAIMGGLKLAWYGGGLAVKILPYRLSNFWFYSIFGTVITLGLYSMIIEWKIAKKFNESQYNIDTFVPGTLEGNVVTPVDNPTTSTLSPLEKTLLLAKWSPVWFFYGTWPLLAFCVLLSLRDIVTAIFAFCLLGFLCSFLFLWQIGYFCMGLTSVAQSGGQINIKTIFFHKKCIRTWENKYCIPYYSGYSSWSQTNKNVILFGDFFPH